MKILLLYTKNDLLKRTFSEFDACAKVIFARGTIDREDRIRDMHRVKSSVELMMNAEHRIIPIQTIPEELFEEIEPMTLQLRLKNGWYTVEELKSMLEGIDRKTNRELRDAFDRYLAAVPRGYDILIWNTGEEEADVILSN